MVLHRSLATDVHFSSSFALGLTVCLLIQADLGLLLFLSVEDPFFYYPHKKETHCPIRFMG